MRRGFLVSPKSHVSFVCFTIHTRFYLSDSLSSKYLHISVHPGSKSTNVLSTLEPALLSEISLPPSAWLLGLSQHDSTSPPPLPPRKVWLTGGKWVWCRYYEIYQAAYDSRNSPQDVIIIYLKVRTARRSLWAPLLDARLGVFPRWYLTLTLISGDAIDVSPP